MDKMWRRTGILLGSAALASTIGALALLSARTEASGLAWTAHLAAGIAASVLFFASAHRTRTAWIQPCVLLAATPFVLSMDATSFIGLGIFAIAIILLFKLGFYETKRILKSVLSFAYFVVSELVGVAAGNRLADALGAVFFMAVFIAYVFLVFHDRLAVFLKKPKGEISLTEKRLTATERTYTLACVAGKSTKEIAFDFRVSESTVRNTLARSYRKLGVGDRTALAALAEKYRLKD